MRKVGKRAIVKKFEAEVKVLTTLTIEAEKADMWFTPDKVWAKALADVIRSGNPDVGEVVSNTSTLKAIVHYAADGTEEERIRALVLLDKIFGRSSEKQANYEFVVKSVDSDEITVLQLTDKEAAERVLGQMKRIVRSRENLRMFLLDLDACGKMYSGFSIDCAKKSGLFNVPYLAKCKMLVGAQFRIYADNLSREGFGVKMLKPQDEVDEFQAKNLSVTDNGLVFWQSPERTAFSTTKEMGRKEYILDPVSKCLERALAEVGPEMTLFFGEQELPGFSESLKEYILKSLVESSTFNVTSIYLRYCLGVWTSLTMWKQSRIREIRAMNNGSEDEEQEGAIKAAVSPGFAALRKDIRRGARFVSGTLSGKPFGPKVLAAAALGASYMDTKGKVWVEDEAEAKSFAITALAEETNLLLYDKMIDLGNETTEMVVEKLDNRSSFGLEPGMRLTFEDGEAVIMNESEEEIGLAVAMNDQLEGLWIVTENEEGILELRRDIHESLVDLIPQGDETKRVFISSNQKGSDKNNNTLYEELMKAQISGEYVRLVRAANRNQGNLKVPQAITIGNKIVGAYRTPFVEGPARDVMVDAIGNCKGKVERLFNYYSKEEGWVTICCLSDVRYLQDGESMPNGLVNMIEVNRQEAIQKRKDDLAKAQETLAEAAAGIELY